MVCIECNRHLNHCECPDIEDRLRSIIATGNAFARHAAKQALFERLAKKPYTREEVANATDEMLEVLQFALDRAWVEHQQRNN